MTVGQVEGLLAAAGQPRARLAILALLWRGDWAVDMTRPVDGTSVIKVEGAGS